MVKTIGINVGEDLETVNRYRENFDLTFPMLMDPFSEAYFDYRTQGISPFPQDVIIDQDGVVRYIQANYQPHRIFEILEALVPTAINDNEPEVILPSELDLNIYPNPGNPETRAAFTVMETGQISIAIYSVLGEKVAELKRRGVRGDRFDLQLPSENLSSGVYLVRVSNGTFRETRKLIRLR